MVLTFLSKRPSFRMAARPIRNLRRDCSGEAARSTGRLRLLFALTAVLALTSGLSPAAIAQEAWSAGPVATGQPVSAVRQADNDVFVYAGRWFRAEGCGETVCLTSGRPPAERTTRDGIPDGMVAEAGGNGVRSAWYADPTARYDHGILGDTVEGGSLVIRDASGTEHRLTLPETMVFEDLTPRIADIDGDGRSDVVAIRTTIAAGAAIAVYSVPDGALVETASIAPIGLTHRWLNIAGIADFNGDGQLDIALVKTPHIGGRLEIWTMRSGALLLLASADGFSNHFIGSTELGMAAAIDVDGDSAAELALPNVSRTSLRIVELAGGAIQQIAAVPLGGPVVTAIGAVTLEGGGTGFLAGLSDGRLILTRRRE